MCFLSSERGNPVCANLSRSTVVKFLSRLFIDLSIFSIIFESKGFTHTVLFKIVFPTSSSNSDFLPLNFLANNVNSSRLISSRCSDKIDLISLTGKESILPIVRASNLFSFPSSVFASRRLCKYSLFWLFILSSMP